MKKLLPLIILAFLQSCASAYHPVYPKNVKYSMHESKDKIDFSYKYNVLGENGNGKYVRRAKRNGFQIVAYKLTNNTNDTLVLGKDLVFVDDSNKRILVSNELYTAEPVKQYGIGFLPYMAGSWIFLFTGIKTNYYGEVTSYKYKIPIGVIIGLPITLGNMIVANFNNTAFKDNMRLNDMNGKAILPQKSIEGILVFKSQEQVLLKPSLKKEN
jgi:hypothetical protein